MNNKGLVYAIRSSSNYPRIYKEGHVSLKQQCMPLVAAHRTICCAEKVPKIRYFMRNVTVIFGRNDTVFTIRGL